MEKFKVKISRILKIISFTLMLSIVSLLTSIAHANPTVSSVSIHSANSVLIVTFSESVYNTSDGTGNLEVADFALSVTGGTATLNSVTPRSIARISQSMWALMFDTSGITDGSEVITVIPANNTSIFDSAGNAAAEAQSNNTATFNLK